MAWYPIVTDNFTRANQAGLGNGWTASTANWSITSNQAVSAQTLNPWIANPALRPSSENSLNTRIVISIPAQPVQPTLTQIATAVWARSQRTVTA